MLAAQVAAHLGEQRVLNGAREVGHANARRVQLPACRATGHHTLAGALAEREDGGLHLHRINGVDHIVKRVAEQGLDVFHGDEIVDAADLRTRVDLQDALSHGVDLGHAVGIAQRVNLAVGVGDGNVVEIDQRELADTASRQRFRHP